MTTREPASVPVVIVGAGPVGLMLACELGLAGVRATVIDLLPGTDEHAPGMAINAAVVELLAQRGLMDRLRGDGLEFPLAHFAHLMLDPARLGGQHPCTFAVPHYLLLRRLEERAAELGARLTRGTSVVSLHQDGAGVIAGTADGATVRCQYLIGCDGGDSSVRALAGIGFPGTDLDFRGVTGDLEVGPDDPLLTQLGFHQHDNGMFTVAPAAPGVVRVTAGEFDPPPGQPAAPVTLAGLRAMVKRVTGGDLGAGVPRWLSAWTAPTRVASQYRAGRVFLAGDAAHLCFPLGGQALSTGMEDAVNLGWKLAGELSGWAPAGLLDSYQAERRPAAERAGRTTRAQTALMHSMRTAGPVRDILAELIGFADVNEYLVKMVGGLDVRYPAGEAAGSAAGPLTGLRLADIPLATSGGDTSVARLLAPGRGVLLDFSADAGLRELAAGWPGRLDYAAADPAPGLDAAALLIRPDGRVAWSSARPGPGCDGAAAAARRWLGQPRPAEPAP
ncbi:MAG TPA: FAD-dependent monooxygenase [Streptosporangiaceae bacterium]